MIKDKEKQVPVEEQDLDLTAEERFALEMLEEDVDNESD